MTAHAEKGEITDPIIQNIVNNLKSVYDPEIPVNIYDLGLIYDITLTEKKCDPVPTLTNGVPYTALEWKDNIIKSDADKYVYPEFKNY